MYSGLCTLIILLFVAFLHAVACMDECNHWSFQTLYCNEMYFLSKFALSEHVGVASIKNFCVNENMFFLSSNMTLDVSL